MNHAYRLVWNEAAQRKVSAGQRKCLVPMVVAAGLVSAWTDNSAQANPTGGSVVAGQGTITQHGDTTTVSQQSQNLSLNWIGFSIAPGQTVQFLQPSSSAIALNRVTGNDASQIYGRLAANGQVFLVNPNGVLFGRGAQVNVGGLVASTLNISDTDFIAGDYRFKAGASSPAGAVAPGSVVNQGTLTAARGGSVALLGGQVSNQGTIRAQLGTVALAAGSAITLDFGGNKLLNVKVEQGAVGALVENRQLIQADGGTVIMTASARDALLKTVVNNTGIVEARTLEDQGGEIKLLGSPEGGTVNVDGTLDASAPNGGNGGSIETSGVHVEVANSAVITTRAPHGQSGTWLIDPPDFTIAASGGDITGAALGANLDNGNVTILSSQGTVNVNGSGDINVNDNVSWNSGTTLTLSAVRNVNVNAVVANANPGNGSTVTLRADSGGVCVTGTAVCGTVTFDTTNNAYVQADTVNIYYNPAGSNSAAGANGSGPTFANPTDYTTDVLGTISGTANTFMLVNDANQLQAINENAQTKAANYALGTNIDAAATAGWNSGAGFVPLGTQAQQFTGTLDGLGHFITGLNVNRPGTSYVGLFGYAGSTAVIDDLGLLGGSITGAANVGGLVGWNRGRITNAYSTAAVSGTNVQVGGLLGVNQGTVANSHATGDVTALGDVGGLVGWNNGAVITDSYATGSVSSSSASNIGTGGLVGYMFGNASISGSYATGSINAVAPDAGGLVGAYDSNGLAPVISNSYATGSVHGTSNVGGLVGAKLHNSGSIIDCYATGAVSGSSGLGGLAGDWAGGTITASFWDTQQSGQSVSAGGGIGMTSAQMQTQANFTSATAANGNVNPGWSFAGTWRMYGGRTTPLLESFLTPLTITADNFSNTYNGNYSTAGLANAVYSIAGAATSGHVQGIASPYASDRNAGTYSAGIWSDQQGYDITLNGGHLTITAALLTLTTSNVTKTYDGTTSAVGSAVAGAGTTLYGSDSLSGGTFAYTDRNAGVGDRTVTVSGITVNDGNGGSNYNISYANNTTSTINPALLAITAAPNSKPYDGTTSAAAAPTVSGLVAGDTVTGLSESYSTKNAQTGKLIAVTGYVVNDGNAGGNYAVTTVSNNLGVINPALLSVSGGTAASRTYDGSINANVSGATLHGLVAGDAVSLLQSGQFADRNVGTHKPVAESFSIEGADAANYVLAQAAAQTTATITPASITVSGITANNKPYDATTVATLSTSVATLSGRVGGDDLGISVMGSFASPNAGTGKTVTLSALSLTGASRANYVLSASGNETTTTASITPDPLTVTAINQTRAAGAPNPALTLTYQGFVGGQNASSLTQQPTVSTTAGASSPPGSYPLIVADAVDPNYTFTYIPGVLTITGTASASPIVSGVDLPGYIGALASAGNLVGVAGGRAASSAEAVGSGAVESIEETVDSAAGGPFSEERALEGGAHATDYLSKLSLEILNGGMKMPPGTL